MRKPDELEAQLGEQLRSLRIRKNIDQRVLAERAGIALNAVKNLESGRGATVRSLVEVLRTLGRADWIGTLSPHVSISPVQMLLTKSPRKRVSPRSKDHRRPTGKH
ncbi:MAG: helix-turn-helix domain-containing protein [Cyanobacteria bacterium]|nr:helix-turn-helix domain-containing protein [Cyanobacteriota bacterium]